MPIVNQIGPDGLTQPYSSQMNFGQLTGRVNGYATHCSASHVQNVVNNIVRRVYDRRYWYGLFVRGQIVSTGFTTQGSVALTLGSPTVQGTGTAWTTALIGQQFRLGFIAPIYTILAVDVPNQRLTLELPWGLQNFSSTGYIITQMYFSIPNIKYFYSVKNLQLYYRMWTGVPQSLLENWDPGRLQMLYPRVVATMPPTPQGNFQFELWPAPNVIQAFPYLAYIQPPNLVDDTDNFPAFMRADMIELGAISEVLLYKPKANVNYSEAMCLQMSKEFQLRFAAELASAEEADEGLMRQNIVRAEEMFPYAGIDWRSGDYIGGGGFLAAMSPTPSYGWDGDY